MHPTMKAETNPTRGVSDSSRVHKVQLNGSPVVASSAVCACALLLPYILSQQCATPRGFVMDYVMTGANVVTSRPRVPVNGIHDPVRVCTSPRRVVRTMSTRPYKTSTGSSGGCGSRALDGFSCSSFFSVQGIVQSV